MNNLFDRAMAACSPIFVAVILLEGKRRKAREKAASERKKGVNEMHIELFEITQLQLNNWILSRETGMSGRSLYSAHPQLCRREKNNAREFDRYPSDLAIVLREGG